MSLEIIRSGFGCSRKMNFRRLKKFLVLMMAVCIGGYCLNAHSEPIEMLKNGGFEYMKNNKPEGWQISGDGKAILSATNDAFQEKAAASFKVISGFCYLSTDKGAFGEHFSYIPVVPGAVYNVSAMAKGNGKISFILIFSSIGDYLGPGDIVPPPAQILDNEWRKYTFKFKMNNLRARRILLGIGLSGLNASAEIDGVSMTFDPVENPGIDPGFTATVANRKFLASIETISADAVLYVNGSAVPGKDGKYSFNFIEGYNAIAIEASAKSTDAGIKFNMPEHPEINSSWRAGIPADDSWKKLDFNDSCWLPVSNRGAFMWAEAKAPKVVFRQTILWNKTHYGSNRCIAPPVRTWGFSPDTVETFVLALYSPWQREIDTYEFILELPKGFRLLDITKHKSSWYNRTPLDVKEEETQIGNQIYTRYYLTYPKKQLDPLKTRYSLLPVKMESSFKENTDLKFYFYRKINKNITELRQNIPVVVLPPVNGRQPKKIAIQQFIPFLPFDHGNSAHEYIGKLITQSARAGLNKVIWNTGYFCQDDDLNFIRDAYKKADIRCFIWVHENFPLYGMDSNPKQNLLWLEWLKNAPEAQARYFNNDPVWTSSKMIYFGHMYCPSFVILDKAGRKTFERLLKNTYAEMLQKMPEAEGFFLDWETNAWLSMNGVPGSNSWCFCDRCKERFRKFANISDVEDLSDSIIMKKYYYKWIDFRAMQDGEIQDIIRTVCKELDKRYMVYGQVCNKPFWKACKGKMDLIFPGLSGVIIPNSFSQSSYIDANMEFYKKECGFSRLIGQRFSYPSYGFPGSADGWRTFAASSDDGFVHAKSWKSQILRLVATVHGGIDICSTMSFCGGMLYYLGEATRIISEYEDLFYDGERQDDLAESSEFKYPNLLVLKKGKERLILIFNESDKPIETGLINNHLDKDSSAIVYGTKDEIKNPEKITLTVPAEDVAVVHIK